jgi:hypothetical protein
MRITYLLKGCGILIFLLLALGGCGTSVVVFKPSNVGLEMGSPLRGLPPRTFVIGGFTDVRGVEP